MENLEQTAVGTIESGAMKTRLPELNYVHFAVDMAGGVQVVAKEMGVTRQAIYRWIERGKIGHLNAATVQKLSALSGVPIDKLI